MNKQELIDELKQELFHIRSLIKEGPHYAAGFELAAAGYERFENLKSLEKQKNQDLKELEGNNG